MSEALSRRQRGNFARRALQRTVSTPQSIVPLMDGMDCIRYVVGSAREGRGSRAGNPPSVTGTTRCIRIWDHPCMTSPIILE